jgi:HEAT repeat protein
VIGVLELDEPSIVVGACRLLARLGVVNAAPALAKLLKRSETSVRLAAVEALVAIHSGAAMEAIQQALEDTEREVRIAAARGLGSLRYQPARARIEGMLGGKILRDADLTEKIAFFEAYGAVGNADSVVMLDRLLNGKNVLRQKQSPEMRACAALALGRMATPAARSALERANGETNPMVRSAVTRALRQELTP